jgi:hypothetical protein
MRGFGDQARIGMEAILKAALRMPLTDSDGVSGNGNLDGIKATPTCYGTHTLTLSADGKRAQGIGIQLYARVLTRRKSHL